MASIQGIYLALFGRPADPLGLDFFNDATSNGADLTAIGDLSGTAEYQDRFVGQSNAQVVTAIYQSLFGRNPDLAGLAFFTAQLQSGAQDINTIAINILDGAQGPDLALVNSKIVAANQFTAAVAVDFDALAAYTGAKGIEFGQNFIQQIDSADDKLTNDQVAAQVATFGDTVSEGPVGATFTLTTGDDFADVDGSIRNGPTATIPSEFKFTSSNEAVIASTLTLGATDSLADGSTTDTDVLRVSAKDATAFVAPVAITNIEALEFDFSNYSGGVIDLAVVTGAKSIDLDGSLVGNLVIDNLDNTGVTFIDGSGLTSVVAGNGFTADFSGAPGTVAREIIGSGADDTLTGGNGADKLSGGAGADTIDGGTGNDVIDGGAGDDGITGGTGNDTIDGGAGADNIDAGAGNDTVLGGAGDDTIAGGAGNDSIDGGAGADNIDGGAGNDTILGGAGDDIIVTGAGDDMVTGGAGDDAITLTIGDHNTLVFEATAGDNGEDTIANFEVGGAGVDGDTLDFSAFLGADAAVSTVATGAGLNATDSNVVLFNDAAITDAASLQLEIGNAAGQLNLALDASTVVLLQDGLNVEAYYVTTNGNGEATDVSLVGTFAAANVAGLVDYNFI